MREYLDRPQPPHSLQDCLGDGTKALSIHNVLGIFLFFCGGVGLALTAILAELIFKVN